MAETAMMPAAQLWQTINQGISGGLHGAGGGLAQLVRETAGPEGIEIPGFVGFHPARMERETVGMGEWAMIEGGMGRFSRPSVDAGAVTKAIG